MPSRPTRLAAGRARTLGLATRGTTAPNRLRRVDRWLLTACRPLLGGAGRPLVVDLGYGASPVTTVELAARLRAVRPDVEVVGLELDPERVASAQSAAGPGLAFRRGGFELAGLRPVLVRAMNVLRQYDEAAVAPAWQAMTAGLAPGGLLVEGSCDEVGRRACWFALGADGLRSLTLSAHLASLREPSELAGRLPKALVARNVAGEPVHALLAALDAGWRTAAPLSVFGPRQRFAAAVTQVRDAGWPVVGGPDRWRLGEVTVAWPAAPPGPPAEAAGSAACTTTSAS